jgi:hypothetical protein
MVLSGAARQPGKHQPGRRVVGWNGVKVIMVYPVAPDLILTTEYRRHKQNLPNQAQLTQLNLPQLPPDCLSVEKRKPPPTSSAQVQMGHCPHW